MNLMILFFSFTFGDKKPPKSIFKIWQYIANEKNMVGMGEKLNKVTMPIIEHLMALWGLNPHTLGIWFLGSKNNCSPPPSISNATKTILFGKGMEEDMGVFGVKGIVVGDGWIKID